MSSNGTPRTPALGRGVDSTAPTKDPPPHASDNGAEGGTERHEGASGRGGLSDKAVAVGASPAVAEVITIRTAEDVHEQALKRIDDAFKPGHRPEPRGRPRRVQPTDLGWIYFVEASPDSPIKVGWASDIAKRVAALQTAHWQELRVVGQVPGDQPAEAEAHYELRPHRLRGEWFEREAALALLERLQSVRPAKGKLRRA